MTVDINCDLGEGIITGDQPVENQIMPLISSANVACGYHAGNIESMRRCIELAITHNVAIGAHPSYNDRENFGRVFIPMHKKDLSELIFEQINTLGNLAMAKGEKLCHVKAHGALYNAAAKNTETAEALTLAINNYDKKLILFGLPDSALETAARKSGLTFAAEAFPDRGYNDDGSLADRSLNGALITDNKTVVKRAVIMAQEKRVQSLSGKWIDIRTDTLCIHGDNPNAYSLLLALRNAFQKENISIEPLSRKKKGQL
jgi:UPF0271 protein